MHSLPDVVLNLQTCAKAERPRGSPSRGTCWSCSPPRLWEASLPGGKHVVLQTLNHWRALLGTEEVKTPLAVLQPKPFKCWAWFTVGVYASIQAGETFFILAKLHSDKTEILNRLIQPITRCFLKSSRIYPLHCLGFFDVVFLVCFIYLFILFIFFFTVSVTKKSQHVIFTPGSLSTTCLPYIYF